MANVPSTKSEWLGAIRYYQAEAANDLDVQNVASRDILNDRHERRYAWGWPSFTYVDNSWNWGSRTTVHHHHHHSVADQDEKSKEKSNESSVWIKVAAVAITILAAFSVGYFYNRFQGFSKNYAETDAIHSAIKEELPEDHKGDINARQAAYMALNRFFTPQHQIDRDNYQAAKYDLFSGVTLLGSGALLVTGSFAAIPWALTAGTITAIAAAALFLFNKGLHYGDSSKHDKLRRDMAQPGHFSSPYFTLKNGQSLGDDAYEKVCRLSDKMNVTEYEQYPEEGTPLFNSNEFTAPSAPPEGK